MRAQIEHILIFKKGLVKLQHPSDILSVDADAWLQPILTQTRFLSCISNVAATICLSSRDKLQFTFARPVSFHVFNNVRM